MTTFYSNHYSPDIGETGHWTTLMSPVVNAVKSGLGGSRLRHKFCQFIVPAGSDLADDDIIRLMDVKSGDRPIQLLHTGDANWGATATFNFGLRKKGDNNDGALVTANTENMFGQAIDIKDATTRLECLIGGISQWDRGKTFWELVNIVTASTYTDDPKELWTICMQASANPSAQAGATESMVELIYLAGD